LAKLIGAGAVRRRSDPDATGAGTQQVFSQSEQRSLVFSPHPTENRISFHPFDAKGLLNAALEDPNPYLFFDTNFCTVP